MSYISSYLETLSNDISLDDDYSAEEIMTYPLYLDVARAESDIKDEKAKKFYKTTQFKDKNGRLFFLDFDEILKSRASLMQNATSSFARIMKDENRVMCFKTVTFKPSDRLSNNPNDSYEETIKNQYQKFQEYNNYIRHDKNNRNIKYFKVNELHKKGDLHQHNMDFIPDTLSDTLDYIDIQKRAKNHKKIGRVELRLPYKYKQSIIKELGLLGKNNVYYEDYKTFKKGSALIISFFQPNKESAKDIVAYMLKYTAKNVAYSGKKSNEYYVFRKLGIRAFTYSLNVLPSITAYQKIRTALTIKNNRYADLYELQKDIDSGVLTFESSYEKIEAEYHQHCRESIKKVDNTNEYPIIYKYNSYTDICIRNEHCKLVAVSVTFADKSTPITWESGKCERIPIESKPII